MSAADSEKSRAYKIVLMDRTTSPRVNRFLRELLDISVWDASTLMNKIPSVIMEGIPLHRAIEIKSQMGKFGLTTKIESLSAESEEEPEAGKVQQKPAAKPPKEKPRKTSKPTHQPLFAKATPPKQKTTAQPLFAKPAPPKPSAKLEPQHPSRLTTRRLKSTPIFKILLPFLVLLVIVIIIIYLGDFNKAPGFFTNGKIVQKQEKGIGKPHQKTVPTKEDLIARVKSPHTSEPLSNRAGSGDQSGSSGGQSGGGSSPDGAGGIPGSKGMPGGGAGGGSQSGQAGAIPGQSGGAGSGGSGSPGSGKLDLPDNAMAGLEPLGSREGAGLSNDKFRELLEQARKSLANPDPMKALNDYNRFRMADLMKNELPAETAAKLNGEEFQTLNERLKKAAQQANLKPEVSLYPEFTGVGLRVQTNLPDKAIVKVIIRVAGSEETMEYSIPVDMGTIEIPHEGGFPSGLVAVKVILMPFKVQPEEVLEAIGEAGENLKGDFVKGKSKLEYEGYLINRIARSRGDIGRDEAESELKSIMAMQGLEGAELSDFEDFAFDRKLFVTISAEGVDEADFIWKACRSTGFLTQEMDEPPKFLRLVVNGGQYFIPTYKCRRMLREYREDDRAGFDYLINNIVLL